MVKEEFLTTYVLESVRMNRNGLVAAKEAVTIWDETIRPKPLNAVQSTASSVSRSVAPASKALNGVQTGRASSTTPNISNTPKVLRGNLRNA